MILSEFAGTEVLTFQAMHKLAKSNRKIPKRKNIRSKFACFASPLKGHRSTTLIRFRDGSLYSFVNLESEFSEKKA